jgi:hypothetical protein
MRRWGVLLLIGLSVSVASIVTAVPARADSVDPGAAAQQFYALINSERAAAGVPALQWRDDIAAMAVSHSAEMAASGGIWHGSFVSQANLKALNASLLAENVGMGGDVASIHAAFMASEHHRENILDPGLNQVGTGVVIGGDGTMYITEDFLHSKSASSPRPAAAPVAAPKPSAPKPSASKSATPTRVAPRVAAATPVPAASPAVTTPPASPAVQAPIPPPVGIVTAMPFAPVPAAAATVGVLGSAFDGGSAVWIAMFGALFLVGAVGGVPRLRVRHEARDKH